MSTPKTKLILDLCGGTGAWSRPYVKAGYDVRLVTLPENDVRFYQPPENVHGILAAPPCTEFSLAKGNHTRDFLTGMEIVEACLKIIWQCHPKFWCLENPRGFLRQFLGKPPLTVRYWWYGDGLDKPTDLWGYFRFPKRIYTEPPGLLKNHNKIVGLKNVNNMSQSIVRATTPPGFASAFFRENP